MHIKHTCMWVYYHRLWVHNYMLWIHYNMLWLYNYLMMWVHDYVLWLYHLSVGIKSGFRFGVYFRKMAATMQHVMREMKVDIYVIENFQFKRIDFDNFIKVSPKSI